MICNDFVRVVGIGSPTVKMCKSPVDENGYCTNETDEHITVEPESIPVSDVHE